MAMARTREAIAILEDIFPGRVVTGEAVRREHANTLTWIASELPDVVVWAESEADVIRAVGFAAEYGMPIIPFGAGTSLEGHVNAPRGGISLDLSRLDRILAVNPDDLDAEVEAGVTRDALNSALRATGLFFAVDPGAGTATLGGMAATRASGTTTMRYGSMRDAVLSLRAVLADGSVIETGGRARKSAAGYDLTRLLIGSEGTLGIITRLRVRLHPVPSSVIAAALSFATIEGAVAATIEAMQTELALARIEFLDALQIGAINRHLSLHMAEAPTLFVELHGSPGATRDGVAGLEAIAREHGVTDFAWAENDEGRRHLWRARHEAFWAVRTAWPGRVPLVTDVCVPVSRLAQLIRDTGADIARSGLIAPLVGHVGDGNFHAIVMIDPASSREVEAARAFTVRLAERAIAMDGTCTGEHGIGQGKAALLEREMGPATGVMRRIKNALDPKGILNPGKILGD